MTSAERKAAAYVAYRAKAKENARRRYERLIAAGCCCRCGNPERMVRKNGTLGRQCQRCWDRQAANERGEDDTANDLSAVDTSGERCKCGLRLPCGGCLQGAGEQFLRRGPGHSW